MLLVDNKGSLIVENLLFKQLPRKRMNKFGTYEGNKLSIQKDVLC